MFAIKMHKMLEKSPDCNKDGVLQTYQWNPQRLLIATFVLGIVLLTMNHEIKIGILLTYAQAFQVLAMAQVLLQVISDGHPGAISKQALWITAFALTARLVPTVQYIGYVPAECSFLQLFDSVALFCTLMSIRKMVVARESGRTESCWLTLLVLLLCYLIATKCHSDMDAVGDDGDAWMSWDVSWAMATYTLLCAPIQQLVQLHFTGPEHGPLPWAYVMGSAGAVLLSGIYWLVMTDQLCIADPSGEIVSEMGSDGVFCFYVLGMVLSMQMVCLNYKIAQRSPCAAAAGEGAHRVASLSLGQSSMDV